MIATMPENVDGPRPVEAGERLEPAKAGQDVARHGGMVVLFVAAQTAVPGVLLLNRVLTGVVEWYGWGWQMYSI